MKFDHVRGHVVPRSTDFDILFISFEISDGCSSKIMRLTPTVHIIYDRALRTERHTWRKNIGLQNLITQNMKKFSRLEGKLSCNDANKIRMNQMKVSSVSLAVVD